MRKRMFSTGERFLSEANAVDTIVRGDYVMMRVGNRDKPMHPGWMNGMTISTIRKLVRSGVLFRAERNA